MLATNLKQQRGKQRKRKRQQQQQQTNFLAYPGEEGGSPIFVFPDVIPYVGMEEDYDS